MATHHPHWQKHLSLSSTGFGEDELGALYEALYPVINSYKSFGLQIGVKKSEIESIEVKQTDPGGRLLEVLSARVKKTETLTWRDVDRALRSDSVGEGKLADRVYGLLSSRKYSVVHEDECKRQAGASEIGKTKICKKVMPERSTIPGREILKVAESEYSSTIGEQEVSFDSVYRRETGHLKAVAPYKIRTGYKEVKSHERIEREEHTWTDQYHSTKALIPVKERSKSMRVATRSSNGNTKKERNRELSLRRIATPSEYGTHEDKVSSDSTECDYHQDLQENSSSTEGEGQTEPTDDAFLEKNTRDEGEYCCSTKKQRHSVKYITGSSSGPLFLQGGKTHYKKNEGGENDSFEDSSPEGDAHKTLSDAEHKSLIKIFKRCFGKLCCAITNPVETAAQLQEKGLISQSVMKDMITSQESPQVKTVTLIGTIERKICLQPARLFVLIEVLRKSDVLQIQRTGDEMLRKTGNSTHTLQLAAMDTQSRLYTCGQKSLAKPALISTKDNFLLLLTIKCEFG